ESLAGLLPSEIVHRPKQGFTLPFELWMRGALRHFCEERLSRERLGARGIFRPDEVQGLWHAFLARRRVVSCARAWHLVCVVGGREWGKGVNESPGGCMLTMLVLILAVVGQVSLLHAQQHTELIQTFSLKEVFGVSHPKQLIDFDIAQTIDPHSTYMIGPDGVEVPYQLLQGHKIIVQTDLPANSERAWKLYAGRPPAPVKGGVKVTRSETYYEITPDLVGVRIPVPINNLPYTLAPIQGLRYRDGPWTATGPNYLSPSAKRMSIRFHESGPLKVLVEVSYIYDRPEYIH